MPRQAWQIPRACYGFVRPVLYPAHVLKTVFANILDVK